MLRIWGGADWKQAEQVQNKVGRTLLGLSNSTAGEVARGELGWLSLKARRELKQLIYWGKVLKMNDSRLVKRVYLQCKKITDSMRDSSCGSVKRTLGKLKLDHLWSSEAIGELKDWISFISSVIRRKDTELWMQAVQMKPKLRLYRYLKTDLGREDYITWQIPASHRTLYARLRSGTHQLRLETGRWVNEPERTIV